MKKGFIWLIVIGGIGFLINISFSQEVRVWMLVFAGIIFIWGFFRDDDKALEINKMFQSIDNRFLQIERYLGLLNEANEKDRIAKPAAYKIHLGLLPHWKKILEKLAEQNGQKPDDFLEEILNSKELGIKKGEGLFEGDFWFDIFQDEFSGMKQVWSHHHRAIVDGHTIAGRLFEPWPFFSCPPKYASNYVSRLLTLTHWSIGLTQDCHLVKMTYLRMEKLPRYRIMELFNCY